MAHIRHIVYWCPYGCGKTTYLFGINKLRPKWYCKLCKKVISKKLLMKIN